MNIYIWTDATVISTPGIYHSAEDGLISLSSDGSNWITITDKNLGASNVGDVGSFFQRGNNYQFSTNIGRISSAQVNTNGYGPGNYYSGMWFIYGNMDWSSPSNLDLRGDTTDTLVARQGPCDSGYHVASGAEWNSILTIMNSWSLASTGQYVNSYLKIPYGGYLNNNTHLYQYNGQYGFYWSSSSNTNDGTKGIFLQLGSDMISAGPDGWWKTMGANIRPFKNEAVQPTEDRTVIYQPS